ncbi:unnamed protein product [Ectocarpus sp. 4 AP-2014]
MVGMVLLSVVTPGYVAPGVFMAKKLPPPCFCIFPRVSTVASPEGKSIPSQRRNGTDDRCASCLVTAQCFEHMTISQRNNCASWVYFREESGRVECLSKPY